MKKVLILPRNLNKHSITQVVIDFWKALRDSDIDELHVNMVALEFAEPSGVISLYNMLEFAKNKCDIKIVWNIMPLEYLSSRQRAAMYYLVDCGFFKPFNEFVYKEPILRSTMFEVKNIGTEKVEQWKVTDFKCWLQRQTGRRNEFSTICVAIDEIFNNISDHSTEQVGCIFGQFYPRTEKIVIAVSDFGIGIPSSIRNKFKLELSDNELIEYALKEGVSSESVPQNRGAGLSNIMKTLTSNKIGEFTIISNCGIVTVRDNLIVDSYTLEEDYPGTFFEISIDISNEHLYDSEEMEDFDWW